MYYLKMISLRKLVLAISLLAMLGVASCGAHAGGNVGHHSGEIGGSIGK